MGRRLGKVTPKHAEARATELPASIATEATEFEFFAALRTGGYDHLEFTPSDGGATEHWLACGDGSWVCHTTGADGSYSARQGGPSRLWSRIESAYDEWHRLGKPSRERFGFRVDRDGNHTVWLDSPDSTRTWPLGG
ncbi:hypothetical protein [Haloechinothrix sp. LS1_15]|uniref:hypothetical protein n=1 Tax=Haloechinothrix sp. LS1_15 TaxID=2652248 RepID=UPI00294548FC|nr:hypothetical protein [Haloechinothrix sp. LS1_15]MDV6014278.1 hypothetical protein [Haloechinothrix sp. LS1_15]